ncbi:MAG: S-layer homology domain-containing protein [Clostridia bacterium]|nr:S-layer homology domain-containing protein [Clostridia bacterium]
MKKRLLSLFLCVLMILSVALPAAAGDEDYEDYEDDDYTPYFVERISNPGAGEGEADGLIEGGDRENSYVWRMAELNGVIYIATTRNIASALVNMYAPSFASAGLTADQLWAAVDLVTGGDILRNDENEGANIISYDRETGEFEVVYTAGKGDWFRMAVTYGDAVYFGSYSAVPENPQYILKLDSEGNFTRVFETTGSVSLRANCVYDDHLFFAGTDDREEAEFNWDLLAYPTKMAVLRKSNDDDTVWERVADYRDFGDVAYSSIISNWAAAPIWELASHNGYIYATSPSYEGFVIFRGRPADEGEEANEYGWIWEEVAGLNNGVNNPGLSDIEGGEPGTMRSLIGSVYEWNGDLYAYSFDHGFAGVASAFAGMLGQAAGKKVKASEYLFYLYDTLQNPQKIWRLDDETGKFEEIKEFTALTEGTLNEYVWRMGEYDGDLYISTMDAGIFYNYLTQLTNGSFLNSEPQEILKRIVSLGKLVKLFGSASSSGIDLTPIRDKMTGAIDFIKSLLNMKIDRDNLKKLLDNYGLFKVELDATVDRMVERFSENSLGDIVKYVLTEDITDKVIGKSLNLAGILFKGVNVSGLIPEELTNEYTKKLTTVLALFATMGVSYNDLDPMMQSYIRDSVRTLIKAYFVSALNELKQKIVDIFDMIDIEGIRMYVAISEAVRNNEWGFDLYRTSDGENFETITATGFGDKYNYGCSSFLETEEGLYIGTCNPFYGGQLYLLTNNNEDPFPPDDEWQPCTGGEDCPGSVFTDMPRKGNWAHDPIDWALENGITSGTSATTVGPKVGCTRAQAVTFLWRAAQSPEPELEECPFTDVGDKYYRKAVLWAYGNGIVSGTSATTFSPDKPFTRGQIVAMLFAMFGSVDADSYETPFTDVSQNAYYAKAVFWAFEMGITGGTSATTFSPGKPCTRAEIITFLFKIKV